MTFFPAPFSTRVLLPCAPAAVSSAETPLIRSSPVLCTLLFAPSRILGSSLYFFNDVNYTFFLVWLALAASFCWRVLLFSELRALLLLWLSTLADPSYVTLVSYFSSRFRTHGRVPPLVAPQASASTFPLPFRSRFCHLVLPSDLFSNSRGLDFFRVFFFVWLLSGDCFVLPLDS